MNVGTPVTHPSRKRAMVIRAIEGERARCEHFKAPRDAAWFPIAELTVVRSAPLRVVFR